MITGRSLLRRLFWKHRRLFGAAHWQPRLASPHKSGAGFQPEALACSTHCGAATADNKDSQLDTCSSEVTMRVCELLPPRLVRAYDQIAATLNLLQGFSTGGYPPGKPDDVLLFLISTAFCPIRLVRAYNQSAATLNLLRGFSTGGYASLDRVLKWNLDFMGGSDEGHVSFLFFYYMNYNHLGHMLSRFWKLVCVEWKPNAMGSSDEGRVSIFGTYLHRLGGCTVWCRVSGVLAFLSLPELGGELSKV